MTASGILGGSPKKMTSTAVLLGVSAVAAATAVYFSYPKWSSFLYGYKEKQTKRKEEQEEKEEEKVNELVQQRFQSCSQHMGTKITKLPKATQLELYAWYKQATLGDCKTKQPANYDLVGKAKYAAWKGLEGMSKTSAMQLYIDKAVLLEFTTSLQENDDDEFGDDDGEDEFEDAVMDLGGLGNRPSTLMGEYDHEMDGAVVVGGGDDDDNRNSNVQFPLHKFSREGNVQQVSKLLSESKVSPNDTDSAGQTALHLCADQGHLECMDLLIKAGGNIYAGDDDGITPLQAAVISGHLNICKTLLEAGADPDQPDHDGDTPRACAEDDEQIQLLFKTHPLNKSPKNNHDYLKELDEIPVSFDEDDLDI